MAWQKKVVWSEGMFLRPQQFQQQERYFEFFAHTRSLASESHYWGFLELEIDDNALSVGKVDLKSAKGIFPDGTPFNFPAQSPGPLPLDFPEGLREQRVFLALPMRRFGTEEVSFEDTAESLARYRVTETELRDVNSIENHHRWHGLVLGGTLVLIEWSESERRELGQEFFVALQSAYTNPFQDFFERNRDLFFAGLRWSGRIAFLVIDREGRVIDSSHDGA